MSSEAPVDDLVDDLVRALRRWGEDARRSLPWRDTRDPWTVLVSEVMLQQTQVSRVVPRFEAFLDRFPTVVACARADRAEVIRAWQGLGYNRRAVHLHDAARTIVADHDGAVPDGLDDLLDLPGVGEYTARAVLAFAFERPCGVVDVNASRVLSRAVAGEAVTRSRAQRLADELVPEDDPWGWNQTVLDLGATVCTRSDPACGSCPLERHCTWATAGWPRPDPASASAGASRRQRPFEGSDRQGRGQLVRALRTGPVPVERIPDAVGWPAEPARARRIAEGLVADGLAEYADGMLSLPA